MIINNVDSGDFPNDFQYFITASDGQEVNGPLKRGSYKVVQPQGRGPYNVILDASPSFDAKGIQSPEACITYYPPAGKALVSNPSP